jgi:hypothetical protein
MTKTFECSSGPPRFATPHHAINYATSTRSSGMKEPNALMSPLTRLTSRRFLPPATSVSSAPLDSSQQQTHCLLV